MVDESVIEHWLRSSMGGLAYGGGQENADGTGDGRGMYFRSGEGSQISQTDTIINLTFTDGEGYGSGSAHGAGSDKGPAIIFSEEYAGYGFGNSIGGCGYKDGCGEGYSSDYSRFHNWDGYGSDFGEGNGDGDEEIRAILELNILNNIIQEELPLFIGDNWEFKDTLIEFEKRLKNTEWK